MTQKVEPETKLMPVYIGVTGHRDIDPKKIESIKQVIIQQISRIRRDLPHTPLIVISPLAQGADQIVARAGLQQGASLHVVLPMPRAEYLKDFKDQRAKREFSALYDEAEKIIELPLLRGNTLKDISRYGEARNRQYEQAGVYIVKHSQIFFALWNGVLRTETGGTARIVDFRLQGIPETYLPRNRFLNKIDSGLVYHIFTPRTNKDKERTENSHKPEIECIIEEGEEMDTLYPTQLRNEAEYTGLNDTEIIKKVKDFYYRLLKRIDDFNHDSQEILHINPQLVKQSKAYFFPDEKELSDGQKKIRHFYALADALAIRYQKKTKRNIFTLIILAICGFMFLAIFDELLTYMLVLLAFPFTFLFAYIFFKLMAEKDYESKFYDYRALAEALRVQLCWKIPGWTEDVADFYLKKFNGEIEWITIAITAVSMQANQENLQKGIKQNPNKVKKIYQNWVVDQKKYFVKRSKDKTGSLDKLKRITTFFFFLTIISVASIFILHGFYIFQYGWPQNILDMNNISDWLLYHFALVIIEFLMILGAACATYIKTMIIAEEAKQYQRMADIFFRGQGLVDEYIQKEDWSTTKRIIIELGKEALAENGEWLLAQRFKPIEIPTS